MSRTIDQTLDRLEQSKMLTPDGRAWLVAAADPFHDSDITLAGYPDVLTASTVVQLVKKQYQVTVPNTVTAGANWDVSIALFPEPTTATLNTQIDVGAGGTIAAGANTPSIAPMVGGLMTSAGPSGNVLWPNVANTNVSSSTVFAGIGASEYLKGNVRLVAAGFEVVNTTSENNAQGQVTVWRIPATYTPATIRCPIATTPATQVIQPVVVQRFPPGTVADAQLLFGTRSWAAIEGAYIVARQNTMDNPAQMPTNTTAWYTGNDYSAALSTAYGAVSLVNNNMPNYSASVRSPFDISGCHFTGLSYTTTLTVNIRWFYERMPGPAETDLVVLATPSSAYDPLALELYARCLRDMPPGVMLKENPLGEWFKSALGQVANFAPKLGNLAGSVIPGASIIGNVVGRAASMASNAGRPAPLPGPPPHPIRLPQSMSNLSPLADIVRQSARHARQPQGRHHPKQNQQKKKHHGRR